MGLSEIGTIAHQYWSEIIDHFPFIALDKFIIMPNHVHGILFIQKNAVETLHATSLPDERKQKYSGADIPMSNLSPKKYSLSSVIRSYKSAVSKQVKTINSDFTWQSRFHDHIIRDENELSRICIYIRNNPENWETDENNQPSTK